MIQEMQKAHIDCTKLAEDGTYGCFVIEPLERGFGHTLGNSLRRVLINSLPGAAVTSVQIDGVQHEFSTVPGVKEDVTELILNLKNLSVKLYSEDGKRAEINAVGPCEVTAGDIKVDDEVEIINTDLHIATLSAGAQLHIQMTMDHGRGYVSSGRLVLRCSHQAECGIRAASHRCELCAVRCGFRCRGQFIYEDQFRPQITRRLRKIQNVRAEEAQRCQRGRFQRI